MIRTVCGAVAALWLMAGAAAAGNVCLPDRGAVLSVTGVPAGNALTLRAGPGTDYPRVGDLVPGQRGLRATGRVHYLSRRCAKACADLLDGRGGSRLPRLIERECRAEGRIWYELRTGRGAVGWASARHLVQAGSAVPPIGVLPPAPPPPPPVRPPVNPDGLLRFACDNGDFLVLQLGAGSATARVMDAAGASWDLQRRREDSPSAFDFMGPAPDYVQVTGNARNLRWQGPGRPATSCRAVN